MEGGREDGKEGRRTRRRRSGYRTKNKNPTRQCGEKQKAAITTGNIIKTNSDILGCQQ